MTFSPPLLLSSISVSFLEKGAILAVVGAPFFAFLVLFLLGRRLPRQGDWLAITAMGLALAGSVFLFGQVWESAPRQGQIPWFTLPMLHAGPQHFSLGIYLDNLTVLMLVLVTFISFLVQVFSLGYMRGEPMYARYYAYLSLFTACMLALVLADNLLVLFMCWELVGFLSYLLIGFWSHRKAAAQAATKAFLVNRIGDVGLLLGIFALFFLFQTFNIQSLQMLATQGAMENEASRHLLLWAGFGLLAGAMGKSAQFPLQVWLPDAMQGPTPVSALIHAATMVAAGVYLLARCYPLFMPQVLTAMALIGALTAAVGALAATMQFDLKKVLAFSTISQLGYMVMGVGVGAPDAALFHLLTHAFFKASLFLNAGIIIHAVHHAWAHHSIKILFAAPLDAQDIRNMGGLRKMMPLTFLTYLLAAAALVGLPFSSGFLSKDALLAASYSWAAGPGGPAVRWLVPLLGFLTVFLTAYYMLRLMLYMFFGMPRLGIPLRYFRYTARMEVPPFMLVPVLVLSGLSAWIFFAPSPWSIENSWVVRGLRHAVYGAGNLLPETSQPHAVWIGVLALAVVGLGLTVAGFTQRKVVKKPLEGKSQTGWRKVLAAQFFLNYAYGKALVAPVLSLAGTLEKVNRKIDYGLHAWVKGMVAFSKITAWGDRWVVDGAVRGLGWVSGGIGWLGRGLQNGNIQSYYLFSLLGMLAVLIWLLW